MRQKIALSLPAFGAHGPYMPAQPQAQNIFPLSTYSDGSFDLDFSSLLVADILKIDRVSYEAALDDKRPYLGPMRDSLKKLIDAGFLKIIDFGDDVKAYSNLIDARVNSALEFPEYWLPAIRHQWKLYKPEQAKILEIIDPNHREQLERFHFGVFAATEEYTGNRRVEEAIRLQQLLDSRKSRNFSVLERDAIRQIVRPFLSHSLACHVIADRNKAPFLDWTDTDPIHRKLAIADFEIGASEKDANQNQLHTLRSLFEIALPELKPSCADDFIKFVKKKSAISSLRKQVIELISENQPVDAELGDQIRNEANKAQLSAAKRTRIISFIGSLFGLGATAPILDPVMTGLGDTVAATGLNIGEQAASEKTSKTSTKKYRWYYTLLEMTHENRKS